MDEISYAIPIIDALGTDLIPLDRLTSLEGLEELLSRILITEYEEEILESVSGDRYTLGLSVSPEAVFELPGLEGLALVFGGTGGSLIIIETDLLPQSWQMKIAGEMRLRFPREWLRPVTKENGTWSDAPLREYTEISVGAGVIIDQDGSIGFDGPNEFSLVPSMIADTGFVIEATVALDFSESQSLPETLAMGLGDTWRGVIIKALTLHLPDDLDVAIAPDELSLTSFHIGSGGISGSVSGDWQPDISGNQISGSGAGTLFGMSFGLKKLEFDLLQNAVTGIEIQGIIGLPFFDQAIDVDLSFDLDGNISITLGSATGIQELTIRGGDSEILQIQLESLTVEWYEGVFCVGLGGNCTPLIGEIDWPSFKLDKLAIDSEGNVKYEGGWIDLPDQYSLDFHGFQIEITQLGFGKSDDGGKWIGFSGALNLVEGLTAGASVEGLRITWYDDGRDPDTRITLEGVGVELEVPNVLRFQGAVSYQEFEVITPEGLTEEVHRFDGDITLDLLALDMQIDATLVVGSARGDAGAYTFFAIYLGVELPAGIPLWSTGLALYGMAGLFALHMEPDKKPDEEWYGMGPGEGWFKRPEIGIADLNNKWVNRYQSLALGAGVTIGTLPDNGYIFSGKVLLVIVFPGPIILIEGKAGLLKERSSLDEEPVFRALAVLDGRAGTFLVGIDAQYKYDEDDGRVIDIHGSAEMFFSLSDLSAWHLYLGEMEPREKRIRAEIISLIEANAYFMIDARKLAMGAWIGFDKNWTFGPVRVILEAWLEGNVLISWKPGFFHGDVWLHGGLEISIFGIGIGITADARFACDVYDPYHILAELRIVLTLLFWDLDIGVTLEWGPEPIVPPLPLPLKEIALEHPKVSTAWPVPRGELLLPTYDQESLEGFRQDPVLDAEALTVDPPTFDTPDELIEFIKVISPNDLTYGIPLVPMDCRPSLTFGRPMHDDAWIGVNLQPPDPEWERIGDPEKDEGPLLLRYGLIEVALDKWDDDSNTWPTVARNAATKHSDGPPQVWELEENESGVENLYGSWAPLPSDDEESVAQTKLMLWSKTPFDYTRLAGSVYDEWFTDRFSEYPCLPIPPDQEICYDFQSLDTELGFASPWAHPAENGLMLYWETPSAPSLATLDKPVEGFSQALCFVGPGVIVIHLPQVAKSVRVILMTRPGGASGGGEGQGGIKLTGYNPQETQVDRTGVSIDSKSGDTILEVTNGGISHVAVASVDVGICLLAVCITVGPTAGEIMLREEMEQHLTSELARWSQVGDVLEPHTTYRLKVVTTIQVAGEGELRHYQPDPFEQTEFTYFRTGGPPGLMQLTLPVGASAEAAQRNEENLLRIIDASGDLSTVAEGELEDLEPSQQLLLESGLNDLTPYVHQTIPATVPAPGEKPPLPRPVYRSYDVGVEFNEDYVDLMYRLARRDLGLYLYDSNNRPVRDAEGRLIVLYNQRGQTEQLYLSESEARWITTVNASECASLDPEVFPHGNVLASTAEGQVLEPDTLYEARLVPLLLHDDFSSYEPGTYAEGTDETLNGWRVIDEGTVGGDSHWEVQGHPTLKGDVARVNGSEVTLTFEDPAGPDLSSLNADFDIIQFPADTARADGIYHIVEINNAFDSLTVDGELDISVLLTPWRIPQRSALVQTSRHWGGTEDGTDPVKPGTMLVCDDNRALPADHPDQPSRWTDYRFSAYLRAADFDAIGVVFRYQEEEGYKSYYRFSMDQKRKYRRLVRVVDEVHTILAEDDFVFSLDQDYLITVEAVGSSLRVYQDGELVFDVSDDSIPRGSIGLYSWANQGARFSDVRVDDYREEAPVVYRFKFTTSQFTNFFHHLHSYQDETWLVDLGEVASPPTDEQMGAWFDEAIEIAGAAASAVPSESEARTYESMAEVVLGPAAAQNPSQIEVTRVVGPGMESEHEALAFLVRSPEPIDWKRAGLEILRTNQYVPLPTLPGAVKLTDLTFGAVEPNEETVTLLLRETTTLSGFSIEYRQLPGPVFEPSGNPILFADEFEDDARGLLYHEEFGPNALDHYAIVDEGQERRPSGWSVRDGHLTQTSNIFGGSVLAEDADKPGTMAVTGPSSWTNVRIRATLRSEDDDALGLVFRYRDANNYYRFSMDKQRRYRRLIKKVEGAVSVLWEDRVDYTLGRSYNLVIDAYEGRLLGLLDEVFLFHVEDTDLNAGQVGFYCWGNVAAHFESLDVECLEADPLLWQPAFDDLSEVTVVDDEGAAGGPSAWEADSGALIQTSNIHLTGSSLMPGTYAVGGRSDWRDVLISVQLRSDDNDSIGLMFRYQDGDNYYRFSMDHERSFRRLIKVVDGVMTVLWQDREPYTIGQTYDLTVRAVGDQLRGYLDGESLFVIYDGDLKHGRIALYCWANTGACFERVVVIDQTRRIGQWRVVDEGTTQGPSVWRMSSGSLVQTSNIHGGTLAATDPVKPGTFAVAGDPSWTNYQATVRMRSDDDDAIGLMFRFVDEDNYYRLSLDAQRGYRRLIKKEQGAVSTLWEDDGVFGVGELFTLTVSAVRSRLTGYMGGVRMFEVEDATHSAGQVGIYCWGNTGARFEQVEVSRPSLEALALFSDHFAESDASAWTIIDAQSEDDVESAPSDWIVEDGAFHQHANIWTQPNDRNTLSKEGTHVLAGDPAWTDVVLTVRLRSGDDDAIGVLFRYIDEQHYYRFSMDHQRAYRRLVKNVGGVFHLLWEDTAAYEADRSYELTIVAIGNVLRGYLDGIPVFVVGDGDLTRGRIGLYCWANDDAWFSNVRVFPADLVFDDWLFDEPFDFPVVGRWTFVDEGDKEGPSQWEGSTGELSQTSNIYGGSRDGSIADKPGTCALAGDTDWDDYRFSVRLRSDDNDAIGTVFRYRDEDNYYRFSMDRERRYRRLIKKVAGEVAVLWEDNERYVVGREYALTMDCVGESLKGYLDGMPLFVITDSDLATGRVGLYCWGNTGARFREARVATPAWGSYYRFGPEPTMPAGTRARVHSGNAINASPGEKGVEHRYLASLDEIGRLRFTGEGADVRLVGPRDTEVHKRRFFPEEAYVTAEGRLLRKADGTGFFITAHSLEAGQYRLKMSYRRDNRDVDPECQAYSEAGNRDPEYVTIDIPWQSN